MWIENNFDMSILWNFTRPFRKLWQTNRQTIQPADRQTDWVKGKLTSNNYTHKKSLCSLFLWTFYDNFSLLKVGPSVGQPVTISQKKQEHLLHQSFSVEKFVAGYIRDNKHLVNKKP